MKFKYFEKNPELYEEGFDYRKINQQVSFLDKLFSKYKSKEILDVACGHTPQGRKLAKKGYNVSGIDLSESLLKLGEQRAKEEGVKIKLYKKDMRKFNIGKFDAAYIMFSSILHLYKKKDLLLHFKSVSINLKKNGLYIIDLSDLPFDSPFKPKIFRKRKKDIRTIITYKPLNRKNLTANFTCTSFFKDKKVNEDSFTVLMFISLTLLKELTRKTGFEILDIYSDFKFNKKLNSKKPEYIAVLRKT
jgi:2-polyprenyl-3-methyl-5-hydroxy-6-metoxy-1,4-benzoquinol methylase